MSNMFDVKTPRFRQSQLSLKRTPESTMATELASSQTYVSGSKHHSPKSVNEAASA